MTEEQKEIINAMKRELMNVNSHLDTPRVTEDSELFAKYQNKQIWVKDQIQDWEDYSNS